MARLIQPHHDVVFYPTYGHLTPGGREWSIDVRGIVFAPGQLTIRSRLVLRALRRFMRVQPQAFESPIFRQRIEGFLAVGERGCRVSLRIGDRTYPLRRRSKGGGQFAGDLRLSVDHIEQLREAGEVEGHWLRFWLQMEDSERQIEGRAQLLGDGGVSIISDIDDTIKYTAVHCRRTLLTKTFLHEFEPIDGMPRLYRGWADQGATFHYVSSSPWQLYGPLLQFCIQEEFPHGTFHLRPFRFRDQMLARLFLVRRRGKGAVIHGMLKRFAQRRFILVGDSGERDPEIYAGIARRFPDRVEAIYIRNLPHRPLDRRRYEKAFRRVNPELCQVFHTADELPRLLPLGEPTGV
ncbi:MAG: DUF2183 domain-containing protein [Pirellulaceae bacterium]